MRAATTESSSAHLARSLSR